MPRFWNVCRPVVVFAVPLLVLAPLAGTADGAVRTESSKTGESGDPSAAAARVYERASPPRPAGRIDEIVFARLRKLGIEPAHVCSDEVFLRRVYLDVIGTLPTVPETLRFLRDRNPEKRNELIDRLLARPEFADYWTTKWCDLLRVKAEFPIDLWPEAVHEYHRWIYTAVRDDMPYDRFVRTLLTSNGSNFRVGPVNFYRAVQSRDPRSLARAVALTFMGAHADKWPPDRIAGMAGFFSAISYKRTKEWKEEIVFFDPSKITGTAPAAVFPGGTRVTLTPDRDPREVFADWLIRPDNPWFTRAIVNRVWSWLLGRGIVDPADDIRPDNPPANPDLLAYLENRFVAGHYDVRGLFRLILNSTTYQLSSLARSNRPEAAANFASYPLRRLDAEVLIDTIDQITGTGEDYTSLIPEPWTYFSPPHRSIDIPDGSITSSFLEMFGRPTRDTGEEVEQNDRITATQCLHLLNSTHIQQKLQRGPKIQAILRSRRPPPQKMAALYLAILSRPPTEAERATIADYAKVNGAAKAGVDLAWALINSPEFLYRH